MVEDDRDEENRAMAGWFPSSPPGFEYRSLPEGAIQAVRPNSTERFNNQRRTDQPLTDSEKPPRKAEDPRPDGPGGRSC